MAELHYILPCVLRGSSGVPHCLLCDTRTSKPCWQTSKSDGANDPSEDQPIISAYAFQSRLIRQLPRPMSLQQAVVGLAGSRAVNRDRLARVLHAADGGRKTRSSSAM
jgi:hypothetical protein